MFFSRTPAPVARSRTTKRHRRAFFETLEDRSLLASVTTDQLDYPPGATAFIEATGYQLGEAVKFQILHNDGVPNTGNGHAPWTVIDGSAADMDGKTDGNIKTSWYVDPDDSLDSSFDLSALGLSSSLYASAFFTDGLPTGSIIVNKDALPNSLQDFSFTGSGGIGNFKLDDDAGVPGADNTLSNTKTFGSLTAGTYTISEAELGGWSLTNIVINDPDSGSSINLATRTATIDVDAGECVTVTFSNTKHATVQVVKKTIGGNGTFTFDTTGDLNDGAGIPPVPDPLSITTVGGTGTSPTYLFTNLPAGGSSLSFDEIVPAGWSFTTMQITGGDADDTASGDVANLNVEPGECIVVTYTNTRTEVPEAKVIVVKKTIGGNGTFTFDTGGDLNDGAGNPPVPDPLSITTVGGTGTSATYSFTNLPAGGSSLSFDEILPAGWSFTSLKIEGGDADDMVVGDVAMLNVEPGECIIVTYTNTKDATVRVVKKTIGGDGTFTFDTGGDLNDGAGNPPVPDPLSITTVGGTGTSPTYSFTNLPAGGSSLSFDEIVPAGWTFTGLQIDGGDADDTAFGDVAMLNVEPGECIVVTYTNTRPKIPDAKVIVVKKTIGGNGTFTFDVGGVLNGQGSPTVPDPLSITTVGNTGSSSTFTFTNLPATGSSLSFDEILPAGWTFTSLQIEGGDADDTVAGDVATLNVEPGECIVVTYTNSRWATVRLQKNSIGGDGTFSFRTGGALRGTNDIPDLPGITTVGSTGFSIEFTLRNLPEAGRSLTFEENPLLDWIIGNVIVSGDADAVFGVGTASLNVNPGESILVTFSNTKKPTPGLFAVTPDKSNTSIPAVHILDVATGALQTSFLAYEASYRGGVRLATGDLNGDGIDEIVTAPGRNRAPQVKVFDQTGKLLYSFMPYAQTFKGGVNVAIGDINGDGKNDIITAMSYNGNQVKVYRNTSPAAALSFAAFGSGFSPFGTAFKGGAAVAAADLGQARTVGTTRSLDPSVLDGRAEIIVGNGSGMRSTIKEYTFFGASSTATLVRTLQPLSSTFRGGITLDVARINSDLVPEIIVAAGNGGNSQVQVFNGATNGLLGGFNAFTPADGPSSNVAVHVAAVDTDFDGIADRIFAAQGTDGTTRRIRRFDSLTSQLVDQIFENSPDFSGNYFLAPLRRRPA